MFSKAQGRISLDPKFQCMKTPLLSIILFCITNAIFGQVSVSATQGTTSGTYTTLKTAFDAINAGTHQGVVSITITDNTTETASAVLYQSGYNSTSSYTSISIYPTVTGKTISGALAAPLIDLNGADNVSIDGRLNAAGSTVDLAITNTSTSNTSGTSTIRFINDASYSSVKYCTVKGSSTASPGGNILFYSGTTTGNTYDTLDHNNFTAAVDASRPHRVIFGSSTGVPSNGSIIVSNNNFYNFFSKSQSSFGINLNLYNTGWTISGNSFYETASFVPTQATTLSVIYIIGSSNGTTAGHLISGNYIGGSASSCGGTWTKTGAASTTFYGIYLVPFGATSTEIQGNTIKGYDFTNANTAASFYGIYIASGGATTLNIGTTSPNVIGASTGTGSILFKPADASSSIFYGLNVVTSTNGITNVANNVVGSVTVANTTATNGGVFYGIYNQSGYGLVTINNNTIGSTSTANSINVSSTSTGNAQKVYGIYSAHIESCVIKDNTINNLTNGTTNTTAGTAGFVQGIVSDNGYNVIQRNTIRNLTIANANTSATNTMDACGIVLNYSTAGKFQTISGNTINGISNTYASFAGSVSGIYYAGSTSSSFIDGNLIYGLAATGASASSSSVYGIKMNSGAVTYSNNIINLGDNTAVSFYGIFENGAASHNSNVFHNTIYIAGAPTTGSSNSYALYSGASTNTRDFRNNIFSNVRSNNGATGSHYGIYLNYAVADNLTLNYNDYYVSGTGGYLGRYNGSDLSSLPLVAANDASSIATNPTFASAGGILPANYWPSSSMNGTSIDIIRNDYNNAFRSSSQPIVGALETLSSGFTTQVYVNNSLAASYSDIKAAFDKINDGTHTGAIEIKVAADQFLTATAKLNASGTGAASYTSVVIYPTLAGLSINGNLAGAPLIDLDGADNVTIDGRVNASGSTKSLTIANGSNSNVIYTSTLRLINDATNNIVKYCIFKGAATGAESAILYLSSTTGTTGNDQNLIDNNSITSYSRFFRPIYGILSSGTLTKENGDNTISNNYLYDLSEMTATAYISISSNSTAFTVSGNHLYETVPFGLSTTGTIYGINISSTAGAGFVISGNYIGGSAPSCGGTAYTKNNLGNTTFYGLYLNVGSNPVSSIQGNTISNINISNSGSAGWYGMYVLNSAVNMGTTTPNVIGALTGNGAITINAGATNALFLAIGLNNAATSVCSNNIVGSITLNNSNTTAASNFFGIQKNTSAATITISNNTIGGTTANSIDLASISTVTAQFGIGITCSGIGSNTISGNTIQNITNRSSNSTAATAGRVGGIYCSLSGTNTVSNNTIHDLTSATANNTALGLCAAYGIAIDVSATTAQTVSGNSIYNISNSYAGSTGAITGIYVNAGVANTSLVEKNMIRGLSVNSGSTAASVYGLKMNAGTVSWVNNIVSIGNYGASTVDGIIYGGYENGAAGSTSNWYHNTLQINGSPASGTASSYAFFSNSNLNTRDFRNNILSNARSNNGASGTHYSAYFNYATTGTLALDYNDYYASGTGAVLGYFNALNVTSLPLIAGFDAASINLLPGFSDPTGTTALHYVPSSAFTGVVIAGVTYDHLSTLRGNPPTIGAIEFSASLPVSWLYVRGQSINEKAFINWQVSNETAGAHYLVQYSLNAREWKDLITMDAYSTGSSAAYSFTHNEPIKGRNFYRIVEVGANGLLQYSKIVLVDLSKIASSLLLLGNPVRNGKLLIQSDENSQLKLYNMNGQILLQKQIEEGWQYVDLMGLAKGTYVVMLGNRTAKLIIE